MIRIITDSTCNLPEGYLEKYNIKVASLTMVMNNEKLVENIDIKSESFYEQLKNLDYIPMSEPPSSNLYFALFKDGVMNGVEEFIVITMSSYLTPSYQAAVSAKNIFLESTPIEGIKIKIVDSKTSGIGYGLLVNKIAMLIESGVKFEDLASYAEKYKSHIKTYVSLSDTLSLIKSGVIKKANKLKRLSDVEILLAEDSKGIGSFLNKATGRKHAIEFLTNEFKKQFDENATDTVFIGYSDDISYAKELRDYLFDNTDFRGDLQIIQFSPTVGAVFGLGSVQLAFPTKSSSNVFTDLFT